jgi:pimeloyl-ACP methyl ester carboxylesterase
MSDARSAVAGAVERVAVGDIEVAFRRAGEGRRVALIHGLAQDRRMWGPLQGDLDDMESYAIDVRGHGQTPLGEADGSLEQLGRDLIGLLEDLGPAACVGHSLGGTVALWAAAERPDLVEGVVASATSSVVGRAAAAFYAQRIELFESADDAQVIDALREDTRAQLHREDVDVEALVRARLEAVRDRRGYVNGARAMATLHDHPLNERLERIEVPVLVVSGEFDAFCPWRAAEIMLEHLSNATYRRLDGVGHLVTDEDPGQFADKVGGWLREELSE